MQRSHLLLLAALLVVTVTSCRKKKKDAQPQFDTSGCTAGLEIIRTAVNERFIVNLSVEGYTELLTADDYDNDEMDTVYRVCNMPDNLKAKGQWVRISGNVTKAPLTSSRTGDLRMDASKAKAD